jgi:alkylation response protein AidB-like acyl-CoA dehydrogenase
MQIMLDMTLEYARSASNSAGAGDNEIIRHRLADMAMQCDEARRSRCVLR